VEQSNVLLLTRSGLAQTDKQADTEISKFISSFFAYVTTIALVTMANVIWQ